MNIKTLESWLRDAPIANSIPVSTYIQKLRACLKEMNYLQRCLDAAECSHKALETLYKQLKEENAKDI